LRKIPLKTTTELKIKGIKGFLERKVTPFGTGAKVNCPKEYLGKEVYLAIKDEYKEGNKKTERRKSRVEKKA